MLENFSYCYFTFSKYVLKLFERQRFEVIFDQTQQKSKLSSNISKRIIDYRLVMTVKIYENKTSIMVIIL